MSLKQGRAGDGGAGVWQGGGEVLSQGWEGENCPEAKEAAQQGQKERLALLMSQPHSLHLLEPTY